MGELLDMECDPDGVAAFAAAADIGTGVLTPVGVLDPAALSQYGRLDLLIAMERFKAWADAQQQRCLAELAAHPAPLPAVSAVSAARAGGAVSDAAAKQWVREEVACALRWSFTTAAARLSNATDLVHRLPATLDALETGAISVGHARVLSDAVAGVEDEVASAVQDRVLARGATQTVAEFRRSVTRAVLTLDARGQELRHARAVTDRQVGLYPEGEGMSTVAALLRADDAAAVMASLTTTARHRAGPQDERDIDQRRADAFVTLITGACATTNSTANISTSFAPPAAGCASTTATADDVATAADFADTADFAATATELAPAAAAPADTIIPNRTDDSPQPVVRAGGRPGPGVQVTVALSTLLALDEQPGELAGYGPIPASLARRIAADPSGTWRRLVTDPHGQLLDYGRSTYRPPADLAEHVTARDQTCRMTGCSRPAVTCEQDHIIAWADGGPTNPLNLQGLCSRHHHAKHDAGWQVTRNPDTGTTTWTSPTGRCYRKPPDPRPTDTTTTPATPTPATPTPATPTPNAATPTSTAPTDPNDETPPF